MSSKLKTHNPKLTTQNLTNFKDKMAHLKRLVAPKTWPIKRKGIVFITKQYPRTKTAYSIPLLLVLRDLLGVAQKSREVQRILQAQKILVNGKVRTEPKFPVALFDVVDIPSIGKTYHVTFNRLGKISLEEVHKPKYRLARVESKTKVKGGKTQINLFDGTNILAEKNDYKIGDVIKLSIPDNKAIGKISLDKGAHVFVIGGAHIGESAKVKSLELNKIPKEVVLESEAGEFRTRFENIFVMEKKSSHEDLLTGARR